MFKVTSKFNSKISWSLIGLAFLLSSCSPKNNDSSPAPQSDEVQISWHAGVGQFNGSLDFGNLTSNNPQMISVGVVNAGDSALVGPAVISGTGFSLAYSNCTSIAPGKTCLMKVLFSPANQPNGLYTGTITLGASVANLSAGIDLPVVEDNISVTVGGIDVSSGLDFGVVKYNQSVIKSLVIKNNGTHKVSGNLALSNNEDENFVLSYDSCSGRDLAPKKTCSVKISLSGAGKNGAVSANFSWANVDFPLTATVQNLATVADAESDIRLITEQSVLSPGPVNLGTWNLKQDKILTFNLKNLGTDKGIVQPLTLPEELKLVYSSCEEGSVLSVNGLCSFKLLANPEVKGTKSSNIQVQGSEYLVQSVVREPGDKMACPVENALVSNITWNGRTYSSCQVESCIPSHHISNNQCDPNVISCPVENGLGSRLWSENQYGDCVVDSCNANFHIESGACFTDVKSCTIASGQGTQSWNGSSYSQCLVASCDTNFHQEGNLCVANLQNCTVDNGSGTKLWANGAYSTCQVNNCITNFHIDNNQCVSNTKDCSITDGTGTQTWNSATSTWNTCQVATCNTNFHQSGNLCVADVQSCPIDNAVASQTWMGTVWGTCTVQSCNPNFHQVGNTCVSNTQSCTMANATVASQTWNTNTSTWNACEATTCTTNFELNTTTKSCDARIVTNDASRNWADGTYAVSCNAYKNPVAGKKYLGATGSGSYTIQPVGSSPYTAYCDQVTDNGGWTLNFRGDSNTAMQTTTSQLINQNLASSATEVMTFYANGSLAQVTTPYKFNKPAGFDLWNVGGATVNLTVTNISTGVSATQGLVYGNQNFGAFTCDAWSPSTPYGRFGICIGATNASHFSQFPFYSGYNVSGTDLCVWSNERYNNANCTSSRFLVLYYR